MKLKFCILLSLAAVLTISCQGEKSPDPGPETYDDMQGLIINEVCPARSIGKEGWIEIYNKSSRTIRLNGLQVYLTNNLVTEEKVATLTEGSVEAGGRYLISTDKVEFSSPMLVATFEEVAIADAEGSTLNAFSVTYDYRAGTKPEDGGSYARIPDITGDWTVTGTATPGEPNYKVVYHKIANLVINEVCPFGKWVEVVNTGASDIELEYSWLTGTGATLYTAPAGTVVKAGDRLVVDCEGDAAEFSTLTWYDNGGSKVVSFSAGSLSDPGEGSWSRLPDITGDWKVTSEPTRGTENVSTTEDESGIVLNEISCSEGWVEIANSTVENINTDGLAIFVDDSKVHDFGKITINAGQKVVADINVQSASTITLKGSDGTLLDEYKASDRRDNIAPEAGTSWSRLPDAEGGWYTVCTPTKGGDNYGIQQGNTIAMWVNHSAMTSIDLEKVCRLGIGNLMVHEYIFRADKHDIADTKAFLAECHKYGIKTHIWMQCFWWNDDTKWRCPVIDATATTPASYNQALFDEVINRALPYLDYEIDGIHFDYIRFPGTASKHNFESDGITGIGAITEFCRQATTKIRAKRSDIIFSAALMGEKAAQSYYGQDPAKMSQYIDILMPMAYISSYNYTASTNVAVADWFAERCGDGQVWHGISTYNSSEAGLSAEEILRDCKNIADNSKAHGIALFRYGIGTIPDMNAFYKN